MPGSGDLTTLSTGIWGYFFCMAALTAASLAKAAVPERPSRAKKAVKSTVRMTFLKGDGVMSCLSDRVLHQKVLQPRLPVRQAQSQVAHRRQPWRRVAEKLVQGVRGELHRDDVFAAGALVAPQ